jgi:hypothetical protein
LSVSDSFIYKFANNKNFIGLKADTSFFFINNGFNHIIRTSNNAIIGCHNATSL